MSPSPTADPCASLPDVGDVVGDKYRIDRIIGGGGMGVVMEARHLQIDVRVAIKFLRPSLVEDPHALERFEREARAVFQLKSIHVVRVMEVGRLPAGCPFIVMEYLDGHDLASRLHSGAELSIAEAVEIVLQASEALADAHANGVTHRDLKPENLFLTYDGRGKLCVKVVDFGLSKMAPIEGVRGARPRSITGINQPVGTPNYMAPELWLAARDAGPPADQWALGAILYELVAGAPAFGGDHMVKVCRRILEQPAAPLSRWREDVPAKLEQAVLRALEKDPAKRFPSLGELAYAIAPFGPPRANESAHRIARALGRIPFATAPPAPAAANGAPAPPAASEPAPAARAAAASGPTIDPPDAPPVAAVSTPEAPSSARGSAPGSAPKDESAVSTTRRWQVVLDEQHQSHLGLIIALALTAAAVLAILVWAML